MTRVTQSDPMYKTLPLQSPFADPVFAEPSGDQAQLKSTIGDISCLPPEVLSNIFCHLRDAFTASIDCSPWQQPYNAEPWRWAIVTQVCQTWKELAFNTPTLWSQIILSPNSPCDPNWVKELCHRSKQSPLSIVVDTVDPFQYPYLLENMGRCRGLSLRQLPHDTLLKFLQEADTSRLEYLLIYHSYLPRNDYQFILDHNVLNPKPLRHLRLYSCALDWKSKFLRQITNLWLANIPQESRISCRKFATFLSDLPALEVLHLRTLVGDVVFTQEDAPVLVLGPATDRTYLRRLKHVYLSCGGREVADFLCKVVLPPLCQLEICTWEATDQITLPIRLIFSWIKEHFQPPLSSISPNDTMAIDQNFFKIFELGQAGQTIYMTGFRDVVSHDGIIDGREPILDLVIQWNFLGGPTHAPFQLDDTMLRQILTLLPLDRVVYSKFFNISDSILSESDVSLILPNVEKISWKGRPALFYAQPRNYDPCR